MKFASNVQVRDKCFGVRLELRKHYCRMAALEEQVFIIDINMINMKPAETKVEKISNQI